MGDPKGKNNPYDDEEMRMGLTWVPPSSVFWREMARLLFTLISAPDDEMKDLGRRLGFR